MGGTSLELDVNGDRLSSETVWGSTGGGVSRYESEPPYQVSYKIPKASGKRGAPDVAYIGDPNTGFSVCDSTTAGSSTACWLTVGGTSAGAPQWAALIALANQDRTARLNTTPTSSPFYTAATGAAYALNYLDITSGTNGRCRTYCTALPGYDYVT